MKKILLHGSASTNAGRFVDAGAALDVGDSPNQIDVVRAKAMVDDGRAVAEPSAKPEDDSK